MGRKLGGIGLVVVLAALGAMAWSSSQPAEAQSGAVAWYRIVNEGRSAGTMTSWRRVGQGAASTFPFLEGFEVNIRPVGDTVEASVHDGQARTSTVISCTSERVPPRAALRATRAGDGQPVIFVMMQCSATEPAAH